jgi:hypothetical protein
MNKHSEDIKVIREMMERSSKFLSLSGLSGVLAGLTAIAGAGAAQAFIMTGEASAGRTGLLAAVAGGMLAVSVGFCVWLSLRNARRRGLKASVKTSRTIIYGMCAPLVAGGAFAGRALMAGDVDGAMALTLAFYGVALAGVSKYTFREVNYLGLTEVALGVAALAFPALSGALWVAGFGFCHIAYGGAMYFKYDRKA